MSNIGAVILAAGGSSRLGRPKQLLNFRGETLIAHAIRAAAEARCRPIVVVTGDAGDAIRNEIRDTSAVVVENVDWRSGLGTSIRAGMRSLIDSNDAIMLMTCDQPLVETALIAELIEVRKQTGKPIVASSYMNTLGVPALFDRSCFPALLSLPDDSGAKSLIVRRPADVASVLFEDGAIDIDTPEDFQRLTARPE
ncbi:MAG TPA: nucleotidyltransferase family protein [Chthoniobacterales bacterium]